MAQSFLGQKRLRKYYGKIREVLEMPNLIEVQRTPEGGLGRHRSMINAEARAGQWLN